MNRLKQSFSWWCFAGKGVEDKVLLAEAARIGYIGVELIDRRLFSLVRDTGLSIAAIEGHHGIEQGLNRKENADRIKTELLGNLELAVEYKIPNLICFSGNRERRDDKTCLKHCAETLEDVLQEFEEAGVTLIMELLNSKVNHRDYQCDNTAWAVKLCRSLNSPSFKLLYDIYHMQIMEGDVIRTIQQNAEFFAHYHTAGNPGRGIMNDSQELNYSPIYRAIAKSGYQGFIGHEFLPVGDPVKELEYVFRQCNDSFMCC